MNASSDENLSPNVEKLSIQYSKAADILFPMAAGTEKFAWSSETFIKESTGKNSAPKCGYCGQIGHYKIYASTTSKDVSKRKKEGS